MTLWLDDVRKPWLHGFMGAEWAKTAQEAIALLKTGKVKFASLDHDLSGLAACGFPGHKEETGYTVIEWLEQNPKYWPRDGVEVHSMNPVGAARMQKVIDRHYREGRGLL